MTLRRTALPLFLLVLCLLAVAPSSLGQTESATLSGLITDPQGKVLPDVAVEVTNVDTNVSTHQTTNSVGLYVAVGLKPGRYRLTVTKEGFRRIDLVDLVLNKMYSAVTSSCNWVPSRRRSQ
jgi:Carboxypeptidase regulatory-like domain